MFWRITGDPRVVGCRAATMGDRIEDALTGEFYIRTGVAADAFTPADQAFYTAALAAELAEVKATLANVTMVLARLPPGLFK